MDHLTSLFKLIEITRSQQQYGYALSGIPKHELSDLAAHHFLVTFMAWQLARNLNNAGATLNIEKVLEFALVHDLGELFGGDIAMPYAKINPHARKLAKAFETENQKFLLKFFGNDRAHLKKIMDEVMDAKSDEAVVAKIADYLECIHYKLYTGHLHEKHDMPLNATKIKGMVSKIKDSMVRKTLEKFIRQWDKEVRKGDTLDVLYEKANKEK